MDKELLLQHISYVRDLGSDGQSDIEKQAKSDKNKKRNVVNGINLKRDAAKELIDHFLKDPTNDTLLSRSFSFYVGFAILFQQIKLESSIAELCAHVKEYKFYKNTLTDTYKDLPLVLELADNQSPQMLHDLKGLNWLKEDFNNQANVEKAVELLEESAKTIDKLNMHVVDVQKDENKKKLKKAKILHYRNKVGALINPFLWSISTKVIAGVITGVILLYISDVHVTDIVNFFSNIFKETG